MFDREEWKWEIKWNEKRWERVEREGKMRLFSWDERKWKMN